MFFALVCANAQSNEDFFRATGKIYVVVAILFLIFSGIFFYLIRLDNKLSRLEKEMKE